MKKWEYLVVGPFNGHLKGVPGQSTSGSLMGFKMNDEEVRFNTYMDGIYERLDRNCEIYKKWINKHGFLNDLGDEGWELIKSSDPYIFKRPVDIHR